MSNEAAYYNDAEAERMIARRVCARCYGDLVAEPSPEDKPGDHSYVVLCPDCRGAWNYATVSKGYASEIGQRAIASLWEVKRNLPDLFSNSPKRASSSEDQLMKDLGY